MIRSVRTVNAHTYNIKERKEQHEREMAVSRSGKKKKNNQKKEKDMVTVFCPSTVKKRTKTKETPE